MRGFLITLLVLVLIGAGAWYFLYRNGAAGTNPMCVVNNSGSVVVTNKCQSAYDLSVDGTYIKRIEPGTRTTLDISANVQHKVMAKQAENILLIARSFRKSISVAQCSSYSWVLIP